MNNEDVLKVCLDAVEALSRTLQEAGVSKEIAEKHAFDIMHDILWEVAFDENQNV